MTDDDDNDDPTYSEYQSDIPADSGTLFTIQRRFSGRPRTLSRNRQRYNNYTNYNPNNYRRNNAGNTRRQ